MMSSYVSSLLATRWCTSVTPRCAARCVVAADEVRARVDWVSRARGGDGAARELIELVLRARGQWENVLAPYVGAGARVGAARGRVLKTIKK